MRWNGVVCAGVLLLVTSGVYAQDSNIERLDHVLRETERQEILLTNPTLSAGERAQIDYGAIISFDYFSIGDTNAHNHGLRLTDGQLYSHINLDNVHEFYGRIRYTYEDWNTGQSLDGRGDRALYPIADRWWYRFDLKRAVETTDGIVPDYNVTFQVGRQYVEWGSGLVLSNAMYAARGTVTLGDIELEGLVARSPSSTFVDFDSSRPDFDRDTERWFYGGRLGYNGIAHHHPYIYALRQQDANDNSTQTVDIAGLAVPTTFDYNSNYFGAGSYGILFPRLLYNVEAVYENGTSYSSSVEPVAPGLLLPVPQTKDKISAWAVRGGLTYVIPDANLSRLEFETIVASGDKDRTLDTSNTVGGNKPGTTDTAFNAFGFARTGLSFDAPLSNLLMFRVGGSTFPLRGTELFRNLQIGSDFFVFNKLDANAPSGEPTSNGMFMGTEADLYATWRITSDVTLNLRYGAFFPGDAITSTHAVRHFLMTGVTYSF